MIQLTLVRLSKRYFPPKLRWCIFGFKLHLQRQLYHSCQWTQVTKANFKYSTHKFIATCGDRHKNAS